MIPASALKPLRRLWKKDKLFKWVVLSGYIAISIFVLITIGAVIMFSVTVIVWPVAVITLWKSITVAAVSPWMRAGEVAICIIFACILFAVRSSWLRPVYGLAEVILGVIACWSGLRAASERFQGGIAIAAGIYVMIRGLDNVFVGWKQFVVTIHSSNRWALLKPITSFRDLRDFVESDSDDKDRRNGDEQKE
jgi:hypothetical protein